MVGGVLGALKNKEYGKCINLLDVSSASGNDIRAASLEEGCEELFKLLPNGNIKEDDSDNVCISKSVGLLAAIDCPPNGDISLTTKGALSRPDRYGEMNSLLSYACFFVINAQGPRILMQIVSNSRRRRCEEKENFFQFLGKCPNG